MTFSNVLNFFLGKVTASRRTPKLFLNLFFDKRGDFVFINSGLFQRVAVAILQFFSGLEYRRIQKNAWRAAQTKSIYEHNFTLAFFSRFHKINKNTFLY